ncbi:MAG: TRAP transporter large permease subunit [Candidatus Anstonellales archaeon]
MAPELVTLIMFGSLVVLLVFGVPLAWALSGISLGMTLFLWNFNALSTYISTSFGAAWNEIFITIVLYVAMGLVMEKSGIAEDLFEAGYRISGRLRGGLAIGVVVICAIFAAMAGVTSAACVTMGMIALPAMIKRGYNKYLALDVIAGPSTLGILIPPSVTLIFLALLGGLSVGKLYMAGLVPGVLLAGMWIIYIIIRGWIDPKSCPAINEKFTFKEKIISLRAIIFPLFIISGVLGTVFFGLATPTEAAAVGLLFVFISAAVHRRLTWSLIKTSAISVFRITGMIMFIAFGALSFAATFNALGGNAYIQSILLGMKLSPIAVLSGILILSFILGMFIDPGGIVWIVTPIAYPVMKALGFDLVWFSILFNIVIMAGYVTPPFGFNLFYLKSVVPSEISLGDIYRAVIPSIIIFILGIILMILFPQIILWLPSLGD